MCTAISKHGVRHLFGRTLDLERSYGERVVIVPRDFRFEFLYEKPSVNSLAIMGCAHVAEGVPLLYDGVNEHGLCAAGLNFPGCAVYRDYAAGMHNIASFELIPRVLSSCRDLASAIELLRTANIVRDNFSEALPATPLHWLIADKSGSAVVEPCAEGVRIYDNPFGILTNSPHFPYHCLNLSNYMQSGSSAPQNNLCPGVSLDLYSRGLGGMGLPGDFSSSSRFVRAVFAKNHTVCEKESEVTEFFHIMDAVSQPRGCVRTDNGEPVSTVYTSCTDTESGVYYFTTYGNRRIRAVRFNSAPLGSSSIVEYPMSFEEDIEYLNYLIKNKGCV